MIFYLTILIAFLWLGIETSWLTVRLPCGTLECPRKPVEAVRGSEPLTWHDELPYNIGYTDDAFYETEDFPYCEIDMMWENMLKWPDLEKQIREHSTPKLVAWPVDHQADYPQYKYLADFERIDQRRHGEMIYQRGTLRLRR